MTAPENLVARWARMKRSSDTKRSAGPIRSGSPVDVATGAEAKSATRQDDETVGKPFDPASLPPVETITLETDIRGFLQSRVPAELTRAALRRAWASDPAIRDFIGIAENQWDFNDPNAIPGFGPLREGGSVPDFLGKSIEAPDKGSRMAPDISLSAEPPPSAVAGDEHVGLDQSVRQTFDELPSADTAIPGSTKQTNSADTMSEAAQLPPRNRRKHGGALPS
jgi:hypothetical protein